MIGSIYVVRVPRGKVYLVERFGQYHRTLAPGFAVIAPMTNRIAHKVDVERQHWIDFEIDCGVLDPAAVADMCLRWMSEHDVKTMCRSNHILLEQHQDIYE